MLYFREYTHRSSGAQLQTQASLRLYYLWHSDSSLAPKIGVPKREITYWTGKVQGTECNDIDQRSLTGGPDPDPEAVSSGLGPKAKKRQLWFQRNSAFSTCATLVVFTGDSEIWEKDEWGPGEKNESLVLPQKWGSGYIYILWNCSIDKIV